MALRRWLAARQAVGVALLAVTLRGGGWPLPLGGEVEGLRVGYSSSSNSQGAVSLALEQAQADGLIAAERNIT